MIDSGQPAVPPPAPSTLQRPIRRFLKGFAANVGTSEVAVLTLQALLSGRLDSIIIFNSTGGAVVATVNIRPLGVAAAAGNRIAQDSIASHARLVIPGGPILVPSDIISVTSDTLTSLNVWVSVEVVEGSN